MARRDTFEWWNPFDWYGAHDEESIFRGGRTREEERRRSRRRSRRSGRDRDETDYRADRYDFDDYDRELDRQQTNDEKAQIYEYVLDPLRANRAGLFQAGRIFSENNADLIREVRERLSDYGLDNPQDVREMQNWINDQQEGGDFLSRILAEFTGNEIEFDLATQALNGILDKAHEQETLDLERYLQAESEGFEEDFDQSYEKYLKDLEGIEKYYDDFEKTIADRKSDLKDMFSVEEDLLEESIQQARDFSSSPSIVDATIEDQLAKNLRDEISKRQAVQMRYGGLDKTPEAKTAEDRLALTQTAVAQKRAERLGRQNSLIEALGGGAAQSAGMTQFKAGQENFLTNLTARLIDSRAGHAKAVSSAALNRIPDKMALRNLLKQQRQSEMNWNDWMQQRQREPGNLAMARQDARSMQMGGLWKGLGGLAIGAGGYLAGDKNLMGQGLALGGQGINDMTSGAHNYRMAGSGRTPGYYGSHTPWFSPRVRQDPYIPQGGGIQDLITQWVNQSQNKKEQKTLGK